MKIICDCGNVLEEFEDGVNDSDFYKCEKCGNCFNVVHSFEEIDGDD